jgi:hypothetical protein
MYMFSEMVSIHRDAGLKSKAGKLKRTLRPKNIATLLTDGEVIAFLSDVRFIPTFSYNRAKIKQRL